MGTDVTQLRSDVRRWRGRLPGAEPTYCQGVANKAAKDFEALIKQLAERRVAASGRHLYSLLREIRYNGNASRIDKLPLGTVSQLLLQLIKSDSEFAEACPTEIRQALWTFVTVRNETTHELEPGRMRAATDQLLILIEHILDYAAFSALLDAGACDAKPHAERQAIGQDQKLAPS